MRRKSRAQLSLETKFDFFPYLSFLVFCDLHFLDFFLHISFLTKLVFCLYLSVLTLTFTRFDFFTFLSSAGCPSPPVAEESQGWAAPPCQGKRINIKLTADSHRHLCNLRRPAVPHVLEGLRGAVVFLDHQVSGGNCRAAAVSHVAAGSWWQWWLRSSCWWWRWLQCWWWRWLWSDDGDFDLMMMVVSHQMKTSPQRMLRARSMKFAVSSKKSVIGAAGRS